MIRTTVQKIGGSVTITTAPVSLMQRLHEIRQQCDDGLITQEEADELAGHIKYQANEVLMSQRETD